MKNDQKISIRALAKKTGADRASIARWIDGCATEAEAITAIREHQQNGKPRPAIDPATGLTWFQARMREDTIAKRRENLEQERRFSAKWITQEENLRRLRAVIGRLEQLPGKLRSEAGLTDSQTASLQKHLDDLRNDAANEIETGSTNEP